MIDLAEQRAALMADVAVFKKRMYRTLVRSRTCSILFK